MNQEQRENHRRRLLEMAVRLRGDESAVVGEALRQSGGDASGNLSNAPQHLADLGTDTFEQEMSASLLQNERQLQAEVAAALDRLEQDNFGECQRCGRDVGEGRLQAVPYTRYCLPCAQNAEDDGEAGFQPTLLR
ncbi:MAG TPA: TraR/DksA C4-type zinc finger protein [Gemmataceae bacterium]